MAPRRRGLAMVPSTMVILLVAGCLTPPSAEPASQPPAEVVALVDTGINPYHEAFRAPGFVLPPRFAGLDVIAVDLTLGTDFEANVEADRWFWDHLESERLYWFRETRVLAMGFHQPGVGPVLRDDQLPHGTGTAGTILAHAPASVVVMLTSYGPPLPFTDFSYGVLPVAWAAEQPWIDVISLSIGFPGHVPHPDWEDLPSVTRQAVDAGKIVVAATGNDPLPGTTDQVAGPPWVVSVGGVEPASRGETVLASKAPDFVSDFAVLAPCAGHVSAYCEYAGTSFSTPMVAGAFARAVHELRVAAGHGGGIVDGALVQGSGLRFTNADLRAGFNVSAVYWDASDYRVVPPPQPRDVFDVAEAPFRVTAPVGPAPWVQMGWGYVGAEAGPAVARALLDGGLPAKPAEAVEHMRRVQEAREAYWAAS